MKISLMISIVKAAMNILVIKCWDTRVVQFSSAVFISFLAWFYTRILLAKLCITWLEILQCIKTGNYKCDSVSYTSRIL